jgi:hypothetical protein
MNTELLLPLLITTFVAMVGWVVVHGLNSRRDFLNKRRELRIQYLIEAYRRLESASHANNSKERNVAVESAIADIQLFGTLEQIQLAVRFAGELSQKRTASLDELLSDLRDNLRFELNLQKTSVGIKHLRFESESQEKNV